MKNLSIADFLIVLCLAFVSCSRSHTDGEHQSRGMSPVVMVANDLSNQRVMAIGEDHLGQIWIGTFRGLNRYNVHDFHQYFCTDDTTGLPDNQINDIFRDSRGRLWIATINGTALLTDQGSFRRIPCRHPNKNGHQIFETPDGKVLENTRTTLLEYDEEREAFFPVILNLDPTDSYKTFCFFDRLNNLWTVNPYQIRRYNAQSYALEDSINLEHYPLTYFYNPDRNQLWLTGQQHWQIFDTYSKKFVKVPEPIASRAPDLLAHTAIIHRMAPGKLIFGTLDHGLFLYDEIEDDLISARDDTFPFEVPEVQIDKIFTDLQGNLWLGSYDQGFVVRSVHNNHFSHYSKLQSSLSGQSVLSLSEDKAHNLWIATLRQGVYAYNLVDGSLKNFPPKDFPGLGDSPLKRINLVMADTLKNEVWMGALDAGKVYQCRLANDRLEVLKTYNIFAPHAFCQDAKGRIYVGLGVPWLGVKTPEDIDFKFVYSNAPNQYGFLAGIQPLDDKSVMVTGWMHPLQKFNPDSCTFSPMSVEGAQWKNCIRRAGLIPTALHIDREGHAWIGTVGNGLLCYTPSQKALTRIEGLPCTDISAIEEDSEGRLWISFQYGLSCYNPADNTLNTYYSQDGIGGNQFYDRSSCHLSDGSLVFGGTHGITIFNPDDFEVKRYIPLCFQDLKVHNQMIHPSVHPEIIKKQLAESNEINLAYDQNTFSISFSALDYASPEQISYQYRLEGHDPDWIEARHTNEAYYAKIMPGNYVFKVRLANTANALADTEISIPVHIHVAPWLSWWALLAYAIIIGAIVFEIIRYRAKLRREKEKARLAMEEKQQERRVNEMNMSFFANVSHEFRTPLTMIAAPLRQLEQSPSLSGQEQSLVHIVQRSVGRMLRLVNQLLDFNKLENDTLRLQVTPGDLNETLRQIVEIFQYNCEVKGIELVTEGLEEPYHMNFDSDKVEKIVGNLLSNAVKFTPSGGKITLQMDVEADKVKIIVSDSGPGIPSDQLEKIFERYYQLNRKNIGNYNWGAGIGLYYARALAKLHHGWLAAEDSSSGATFVLELPNREYPYVQHEIAPEPKMTKQIGDIKKDTQEKAPEDAPLALIVDDDTDVVQYLHALLSPYFRVITVFDAETGFATAKENHPDIIISDVVMPGEDGYEFCRHIKDSLELSHIPMILVTAKTSVDNQVQGLNSGADAYVTKPFDPEYILALIKSLLTNRQKLQQRLAQATTVEESAPGTELNAIDKAFLEDLYKLMEAELSNSELDVARITEMMHISRTKFYYKVKGLTGENPAAFFKAYKLNRAAQLIRTGKHTISEIADLTGFSTLSHFSTSFKKHFGCNPSEY